LSARADASASETKRDNMKIVSLMVLTLSAGCVASAQASAAARSNQAAVDDLMTQIAGHEGEPASKVFHNIQLPWFKNTPAGTFLSIMKDGYSAALGVRCAHCHVEGDFSKDDKRPKRAAREMAAMHFGINQQLAKMKDLKPRPAGRFINCSTCHRGSVDPLAGE